MTIIGFSEACAFGGCDEEGCTGVFCTEPNELGFGNPYLFKKTIEMGRSVCEDEGIEALLAKLMDEWQGDSYDLTRRNCCHFSEALCQALGVDEPFPKWVNRLAGAGAAVGDAAAAALLQAQQLDERYRIRETSGSAWRAARAQAAALNARYRMTERADKAVAHVQQRLDESKTVQRGLAQAKLTASAIDATLGGLIGGASLSDKAATALASVQNRVHGGLANAGVLALDSSALTSAAKAPVSK